MSSWQRVVLVGTVACATACSAIVSPDETELGGDVDAGVGTDASRPDAARRDSDVPPPPIDAGDLCPGGCDDGIDCTVDTCIAADTCQNVADDSLCADGDRCNEATGCVPRICTSDGDCSDGLVCNGEEECDPDAAESDAFGCTPGTALDCADAWDCTADACDEAAGGCVNAPDHGLCDDGIDCTVDRCAADDPDVTSGCDSEEDDTACDAGFCTVGGSCSAEAGGCVGGMMRDCRDGNPCTVDSCDEAAATCVNAPRDDDGDGDPAAAAGGVMCTMGTDCDDTNPSIGPSQPELCNGRDDDCDGVEDEMCTPIPDTCSSAEEIVVPMGGTATVTGRLSDYVAQYRAARCGASGGPDAVFYVDVTSDVDITIDTIGSVADTVLAVDVDCPSPFTAGWELGCDDDIDTGINRASRIWVHRFGPGLLGAARRLYILLDGYDPSASQAFTLNVSMVPATADQCSMTPIDISGGGTLVGFIGASLTTGMERGSCQSDAELFEREAIARVTGPTDGGVRFDVYSNVFDPDVYLRAAPCASGTEIECVAGNGSGLDGYRFHTRLSTAVTAGATYFLFVDDVNPGPYLVDYEP